MSPESIATAYAHLMGNYKFQTANYVVFLYDFLLTFSDEVDKIWSQPLSLATLLFYINRYVTLCQFLILQVEFYETNWPIPVCDRYVKFAGATTLCLVAIAELILILRVYGLYLGNKHILAFLLCVLAGQVVIMGWSVHYGIRVPLPPGFPGCVLTGSSSWMIGLWAAPCVTDTCIFAATLWRTLRYRKHHGFTNTIQLILRDGTIYFFIIFSVNLMNCLIYLFAVEDLKAMGASFSQIMTSILITRLQLNLRKLSSHSGPDKYGGWSQQGRSSSKLKPSGHRSNIPVNGKPNSQTATFFTIGNLGDELEGSFLDTLQGTHDKKDCHREDGIELVQSVVPLHSA